jgi:hypothetical protein
MAENNQATLNSALRQKSNFSQDDYVSATSRLRRLAKLAPGQSITKPHKSGTRCESVASASQGSEGNEQVTTSEQVR